MLFFPTFVLFLTFILYIQYQGIEPPRLRSSLRKSNYSTVNYVAGGTSSVCASSGLGNSNSRLWNGGIVGVGGSGGDCTPTNPTPPDSMHSEDSSYVSAKESSSQHSSVSALRVRFSPLAAVTGDGRSTLMDIPVQGQSQDYTIPLKVLSNINSINYITIMTISNILIFC